MPSAFAAHALITQPPQSGKMDKKVQVVKGTEPLPSKWAKAPVAPKPEVTIQPETAKSPKRRPRRRSQRKPHPPPVAPAAPTSAGSAISQSTIDVNDFDWADEA